MLLAQETVEFHIERANDLNLKLLQACVHSSSRNAGWWDEVDTIDGLEAITPTKLALVHSEVSEALEGFRKGLMDDHLPHRTMAEVELADVIIRVLDLAGAHDMDLMGAVQEKLQYNWERADHKRENRAAAGGKKF